jgi:hypothetical protein
VTVYDRFLYKVCRHVSRKTPPRGTQVSYEHSLKSDPDADFAQETANPSKAQVLQQAGISVLAQANSNPQHVLKLLQ